MSYLMALLKPSSDLYLSRVFIVILRELVDDAVGAARPLSALQSDGGNQDLV